MNRVTGFSSFLVMFKVKSMSRSIIKEIIISQSADATFDTLITPSLLKKWWVATRLIVIPVKDGWNLTLLDENKNRDYISEAKIKEYQRPERLLLTNIKYSSPKNRLPLLAELNAEFKIQPEGDHVKLILTQTGFPDNAASDDFYQSCSSAWEVILKSLKHVAETDIPRHRIPATGE